jgi:hypothetical protein
MHRPLPDTPQDWLEEIRLAMADARGTKAIGSLIGQKISDANLFHLAPIVALKFRGLDYRDKVLRQRVTEGALASYVVNSDREGIDHDLEKKPLLGFALCYIVSHFVLDLIDERQAEELMVWLEQLD